MNRARAVSQYPQGFPLRPLKFYSTRPGANTKKTLKSGREILRAVSPPPGRSSTGHVPRSREPPPPRFSFLS
ncbi:hypothetical protein BC2230_90237 [Burkholderia cepacia]